MTDATRRGGDGASAGEAATGDAGSGDADTEPAADDTYGGLVGAFPYAVRTSESRLFRVYAVGGGLLAGLIVVLFALALVTLLGRTAGATGGTFTFSRAFFVVVMVLVVVPLVAPVLLVARRHRRSGSTAEYDRALAGAGCLFVFALYLGLVISAPDSLTDDPGGGPLGAVVTWLYALPRTAGAVPPLVAAAGVYAVHRLVR
jgi:hypothetical protein